MKNKFKQYAGPTLTLLIIFLFVLYLSNNIDDVRRLTHLNLWFVAVAGAFFTLAIATNGAFTKLIVKPLGISISLREGVYLAIISSVGNFFAPAGVGYGMRAVYLKRKYGLSYAHYSSTLSAYYVLLILVNSIIGLLCLFSLGGSSAKSYYLIMVGFFAAILLSATLLLVRVPRVATRKREHALTQKIITFFYNASHGWHAISRNRTLMIQLCLMTFFSTILNVVVAWAIVGSLGLNVPFPAIVLYTVLGLLSMFISITPGNVGIKEVVVLFSASVMTLTLNEVLLLSVVERSIVVLVLLVLGAVSMRLKRQLASSDDGNLNESDGR